MDKPLASHGRADPQSSRLAALVFAFIFIGCVGDHAQAQSLRDDGNPVPGFGFVYGEGIAENDAVLRRFGFTSRRLEDGDRIGSLALMYETHENGLKSSRLDPSIDKQDVEVRYQALYGELKRYFHAGGPLLYYWGLRGGYTRVDGKVDPNNGGKKEEFREEQIGPLALLALPFVLEHPGFLLLALVDGASAGLVLDLVPGHIWLDLQFGSAVVPRHRDQFVALEELFLSTTALHLVIAF